MRRPGRGARRPSRAPGAAAPVRRPARDGPADGRTSWSTRSSAPAWREGRSGRSSRAVPAAGTRRSRISSTRGACSLGHVEVFHMDECLDWQGGDLPRSHPYSFRGFMERHFYGPVDPELSVPEGNRYWPEPTRLAAAHARAAREPGRPGLRRMGTGRPRRLQPGPAAPVQPALGPAAAAIDRPRAGEQRRHRGRAGPAHVRRRLPAGPADVGDPGHARDPRRTADPAVQRHRRLEADRSAGRAVQPGHRRVPDHPPAGPPGRAAHRDGRDGHAPDQPASRVGPRPRHEAALRRRRRHRWHRVGHLPRARGQPHPRPGGEPSRRAAGPARLLQAAHRLPLRAAAAGARGAGRADRQGGSGRRRVAQSWGRCGPPASTPHW